MTTPYLHSCFIPFHLADPAGIVFFGHPLTLMHQAFEAFVIHRLKCPWDRWFHNEHWIVPVRHAELQYLHPLMAGRECLVEMTVQALSKSSFTLETILKQNEICAVIKTVHVFCDKKTKQKIEIPKEIRHGLNSNV